MKKPYYRVSYRHSLLLTLTLVLRDIAQIEEYIGRPLEGDDFADNGGAGDDLFGTYLEEMCFTTHMVVDAGCDLSCTLKACMLCTADICKLMLP